MKYNVKDFTLEEKMRLICGRDWWSLSNANGKLPEMYVTDGPCGVRHNVESTVDGVTKRVTVNDTTQFPAPVVIANSWNTDIARLTASAIADECIEKGKDVLLAPGLNIKRTPLCGRNFEYFSEDPYLTGELGKAYVEGVQSKGIGACIKHFCANNREYERHHQSSEVDERTLREIYLPAFEKALKAQPWSVMCAYNPVNGVYASENSYLLNDVLRKEFGFDGIIISDWYAVRNSARAAKAGLDLEMPYRDKAYEQVKSAYESGWLKEEEIDVLVERILKFIEKKEDADAIKKSTTTAEDRHKVALEAAREGMVLLKNEDNILPIKGGKVLVTGLGHDCPPGGGGSSLVPPATPPKSLSSALTERLGDNGSIINDNSIFRYSGKVMRGNHVPFVAYDADTVVFTIGNDHTIEYEECDRTSLKLSQAAEEMLIAASKANKNIVVVLNTGSAIDMSAWVDKVKAVLYTGFAGEAGYEAVADILTGVVSPSGKLSETFPISLEDTPTGTYRGDGFVDRYSEGIFVGYRYYDTFEKAVRYPFGYGLSYADFEYSDLEVSKKSETDYEISFNLTNKSDIPAKEVVQLYVKDVFASVSRPEKELKAFDKISLLPNERKRITLTLDARAFAFYSLPMHKWYVENGAFEIYVAASSRDIRLKTRIDISLPEEEQATFTTYDLYK